MNYSSLANTYLIMRHGESLANREGLIVSDPEKGLEDYGLTEKGRQDVIENARSTLLALRPELIVTSDFLRTVETASILSDELGVPFVREPDLRERFFGPLEGEKDHRYQEAWEMDREGSVLPGVEPVEEVLARMEKAIERIEEKNQMKRILLVSHGDPLQILITAAQGLSPGRHRELPPLQKGEIRTLKEQGAVQ
jgi:probable phosphoglycerate mutase